MFLDPDRKPGKTLTRIPDEFNMILQSRFFVNDQQNSQSNVVTASELFVDYSDDFKSFLTEANIDYFIDEWFNEVDHMTDDMFDETWQEGNEPPIVEQMEEWEDEAIYPIPKSQFHGHEFKNMFKPSTKVDLTGKIVTEYLFDDDGHFSGVVIEDVESGELSNFMPDNLQRIDVVHVPDYIRESYEHTRLIGFRTTKRCDTSRFVQQVQPIYFSIDEKMCKE